MRFFLPRRLAELEYLASDPDPEYEEIAEPYQRELDFAFFAANLGYSRRDYDELTPLERVLILKAWENKVVSESYMTYNACFTAYYNVNRKKGKKALKLWRKASVKKADTEVVRENIAIAREVAAAEGDSWVDLIYKANGLKRPKSKKQRR